jgi:hypothetical protein
MNAFANFFYHFRIKDFQILRTPAGNQSVVNDDFPIVPGGAGVFQVGFD